MAFAWTCQVDLNGDCSYMELHTFYRKLSPIQKQDVRSDNPLVVGQPNSPRGVVIIMLALVCGGIVVIRQFVHWETPVAK